MASILAKARAIASRLWRAAGEDPDTAIVGAPADLGAGEAGMLNADLMSMSVQQYRVSKDRAERHAIRTRMDDEDGVISKALDVTADTAFSPEEDADDADETFELESDGTTEGDAILEEAERLCEQLHLQQETWGTARQVLQFGNRMCEIVLDPSGTRVVRLKSLPEEQLYIRRDVYGNPQDPPWEQRSYYQQDGAGIGFAEWQIVHYLHRPDNAGLYGRGVLDCERDWMRLQALEDGMVQIRLHRAGDKLIHYIPVDKAKGATEVQAQVNAYRESLRKKRTLSALSGTQRRDSPTSVTDDFFVPVPYGETLSKVGIEPYAPQNYQIQQIRDVEYMRARVLARIGVPMRYLQIGGTEGARASLGEGGISQEDVAFARTCRKLQADVRTGHMKPITIHLMLRGMNPIDHPLTMKFPVISTSDEKRKADTDNVRAQTAKIISDLVGIPPEILLDRYVKASPDEREAWLKASAEILADRAAKAAAATAALAQANQANQQGGAPDQGPPQNAQDRRQSLRQAAEALLVVASAELGIEPLREAVHEHPGGNGRLQDRGPYPAPARRS
jgi:hypothetical protein